MSAASYMRRADSVNDCESNPYMKLSGTRAKPKWIAGVTTKYPTGSKIDYLVSANGVVSNPNLRNFM